MNRDQHTQMPADGAEHSSPNGRQEIDEARLTAYVLGELSGEEHAAEREGIERELAESEAARATEAEIRRSVELMTAALATEPAGALSAANRERIEEKIAANEVPAATLPLSRMRRFRRPLAAAMAACLALAIVSSLYLPRGNRTVSTLEGIAHFSEAATDESDNVVGEASQFKSDFHNAMKAHTPPQKAFATGKKSKSSGLDLPLRTMHGSAAELAEFPPGIPAEKNSHRVPYTINKPVYETKSRAAAYGPSVNGSVDDPYELDLAANGGRVGNRLGGRQGELSEGRDGLLDRSKARGYIAFNTEGYSRIVENPFLEVRQNPLSTFSIDVDTASYANVRRFLNQHALPPKDAVRIEELVNYFKYDYAPPADDAPFAVHAEIAGCPWAPKHRLLRVALKGREIDFNNRPASNLVFLIDVSGSMDQPNKLPLLKAALRLLIDRLSENDRIAMVVYAGSSGLVLPSTTGDRQAVIAGALEQLQAGGSTNGASGIQLAYETARQNFIRGGVNRVILCTDGDFNVGATDQGALTRLIETEAKSDVFLSVLGFGDGNYKDAAMESLADRGNGNYAYIDNLNEAHKVLVEQAGGTLVTIAKDVKLQLEFNPRRVAAYRLVGYENRMLRNEDFNDDAKDAGEIGAGHTVTAFYELVPAGDDSPAAPVDPLKYQQTVEPSEAAASDEVLILKLRYKEPDGAESKLIESVVKDAGRSFAQADADFQFAASVAGFGLLLRDSEFKGDLTFAAVLELASASRGADEEGYRAEFIGLVKQALAVGGVR
ncbi:MAG TPA: VWA domain-containing protein [Pirellulales bacterium]|nr:VWA domain-containing protein [Pirellulales bacterium]